MVVIRICSFCLLLFCFVSCTKKRISQKENNKINANIISSDSLSNTADSRVFYEEQIDTTIKNIQLHLRKIPEGITLKYQLNHSNREQTMSFKYFDYSDIIFPISSIGVLMHDQMNGYVKSNLYLLGDSILVLPLIGMTNSLSIYMINLKDGQVIADDVRTSISLLWINEKEGTMLTSDNPEIINEDESYEYKFIKSKITSEGLKDQSTIVLICKTDLSDDINRQFEIAQNILR